MKRVVRTAALQPNRHLKRVLARHSIRHVIQLEEERTYEVEMLDAGGLEFVDIDAHFAPGLVGVLVEAGGAGLTWSL